MSKTANHVLGVHGVVRLVDFDCGISLGSVRPSLSSARTNGTCRDFAGRENTIRCIQNLKQSSGTSGYTKLPNVHVYPNLSNNDSWIGAGGMGRLWGQTSPSTSDLQSPFLDRQPSASLQMEIAKTNDFALCMRKISHPDYRSPIRITLHRKTVSLCGMAF